jgi:hypothetical protein
MSRTKRFYNFKTPYTKRFDLFRPYGVWCMGNCHTHKRGVIREMNTKTTVKLKVLKFEQGVVN